ncbi:hypothetical protein DWW43_10385 [Clostridium sp. AF15-41]|uniref:hypothetical protein n=1 Tax=Clostridium sp. AF15-41 TaxID=2292996 RepID=UPI000E7462B2|nr:hypothetical protein [Clostridium sp. AF15-41]RJW98900.1 hypothetical protein DWW43_10385 [Clostridium sp. AF15-41]
MGTGISMSSVNKIKELAASGDYSLALDILEHQDLTRSLSPQFIKICGEVYYENGRYSEARAALVKAHSMAPVGNKIIYSLIKVYLSEGFYTLVDTYYDIYKFNQDEKDAGTYRIEYMIAKAKRKSFKELYGILISANEAETDAAWDFEMLLLYAAMGNMEKLQSEAEIFCATYKGSPYIENVNRLRDKSYDVEKTIYCYPASEQEDDSKEQEEIRTFEQKVLEADHLRMFPKDPKITLMVDDREPIPNSVKFKQMLLKSKEKKELKKQQKKEQQENEQSEEKKDKGKRFHIGRLSKKEEAAIEEVIAETEKLQPDKDKLLDEVMAVEENIDSTQSEDIMKEPEEPETASIVSEEKNLDQISEESFDESLDDFDTSDITDDFDTVLMVDPDALEQSEPEIETTVEEETAEPETETTVEEETAEPETETIVEEETAEPETEKIVEEETAEPETETTVEEETAEPETEEIVEKEAAESDTETVIEKENTEPESEENTESEIVVEEAEYAEPAEPHENAEVAEAADQLSGEDETVLMEEPQISENEELSEDVSESEGKKDHKFDIDVAIQSLDEYKFDTDDWEDDSFEQAYEDDDIVEISEVPEDLMPDESDEDIIQSETEEIEQEEDVEAEIIDEAEVNVDVEAEESEQAEPETTESEQSETDAYIPEETVDVTTEAFDESVPDELDESASEVISEQDYDIDNDASETEISEAKIFETDDFEINDPASKNPETEVFEIKDSESEILEPVVENSANVNGRKIDFPTFRSSLFPDYNSDKPPVVEHVKHEDIQEEYDQKMAENLKKEEALISETDELLARLGIELGTKYASNTDYFNMHQDSFVLNPSSEDETDESENIKENDSASESEAVKKSESKHSDEKKYKLKKK